MTVTARRRQRANGPYVKPIAPADQDAIARWVERCERDGYTVVREENRQVVMYLATKDES